MSYTNSPMVVYTRLSPNHSGLRTHAIDRISPHCVVGQVSVERLGDIFAPTSKEASSNYGIGVDGRVAMYVEEKNRSWCTSSRENDQRAVTIECASDTSEPYTMNSKVYETLITLCTDICRRNGKSKLLWFADKTKTLAYEPKADEMVITVHRWFASKSCPGNWLYSRLGDLAAKVTANLGMTAAPTEPAKPAEPKPATETKPFLVRISVNDLNIRKGAGTTFARTGKYTGKGVFTIVETKEGPGSDSGWGKLKSGAGWIALDYAKRV